MRVAAFTLSTTLLPAWLLAAALTAAAQSASIAKTAERPNDETNGLPSEGAGPGRPQPPALTASARPSRSVGSGTVRVRVLGDKGEPVNGADVVLISLANTGQRKGNKAKSDKDGYCLFSKQATGDGQAYLVSVPHGGTRYRSNPFRLANDVGYEVVIHRFETTRDTSKIVISTGQLSIGFGEGRLAIEQTVRLVNMGRRSVLFPESGLFVKLPAGYKAFRSPRVMSEQQLAELPGRGFEVRGSFPPGAATLSWGFDLPVTGEDIDFTIDLPWKTMAFRVVADVRPGIGLEVSGMPKPTLIQEEGRRYLLTESRRKGGDPPLSEVSVFISGIPGPGPLRWAALVLSAALVSLGILVATRNRRSAADDGDVAALKERLLSRAVEIESLMRDARIGPDLYRRERDAIVAELSVVLRAESSASSRSPDSPDITRTRP